MQPTARTAEEQEGTTTPAPSFQNTSPSTRHFNCTVQLLHVPTNRFVGFFFLCTVPFSAHLRSHTCLPAHGMFEHVRQFQELVDGDGDKYYGGSMYYGKWSGMRASSKVAPLTRCFPTRRRDREGRRG